MDVNDRKVIIEVIKKNLIPEREGEKKKYPSLSSKGVALVFVR